MTEDRLPVPLLVLGAAGAFTLASLLRPRAASAAPTTRETPPTSAVPPPMPSAPPRFSFDLARPVPGDVRAIVSSGWLTPRRGHQHRALDIPIAVGTPILAIDGGTVVRAVTVDHGDAGRWVAVRHPSGLTSRYLHLSRVLVNAGQVVNRGERLGLSGNTGNSAGPHLHLDLRAPAALLPAVAQAIGQPRSGWGPDMRPFGHSIPGEPFVPVDGYRPRVRRDAVAEGIPLRDLAEHRNAGLVYRPVGAPSERYPDWLHRLKGSSGVYIIRERDRDGDPVIVYVGASGTGRLFATLTRHFQTWRRWKGYWRGQFAEGHDPGLTYPRERVEVAVRVTSPARAFDEEARLIARLRPRDNLIGQPETTEEVPF